MKVNQLSKLCKILKLIDDGLTFDMGAKDTWNVDWNHVTGIAMHWDTPLTDHPHLIHVDSLAKGLVSAKSNTEVYFPKDGESHTIGRITYPHNIAVCPPSDMGRVKKSIVDGIREHNRCVAKIMKEDVLPFFKNKPFDNFDNFFSIWSLNGRMGIGEQSIGYVDLGEFGTKSLDIWSNFSFDYIRNFISLLPNVELTFRFDDDYPLLIEADLGFVQITYCMSPRISSDDDEKEKLIKQTKTMIGIKK